MPFSDPLDREQLFRELNAIKDGIDGIHARLDVLNSRTRKLEIKVAIQWMLWTLIGAAVLAILPVLF